MIGLELLWINSNENMNVLSRDLLERAGISPEYLKFAGSYKEGFTELGRLEREGKGRKALIIVSSELHNRGKVYECALKLVKRAEEAGHRVILYTSRRKEDLSSELQKLLENGLPYIRRSAEQYHSPQALNSILKKPLICDFCNLLNRRIEQISK